MKPHNMNISRPTYASVVQKSDKVLSFERCKKENMHEESSIIHRPILAGLPRIKDPKIISIDIDISLYEGSDSPFVRHMETQVPAMAA